MSQSSKIRKIDNEVKLFSSYDENIYFHILKYLDLATLWKLRRVSKIFLNIFESYSKYDEKILLIGIVNNTLSNNVKIMNNSFKMNTFNSLDIKDKKDNICLYFDFIKSDCFSKKTICFIPNNSNKIETINYDINYEKNCQNSYFPNKIELPIEYNITNFNITKNNNIFVIKNQLGILLKYDNIFKFHKYIDIRCTYKCGLFVINKKYIFIFGGLNSYRRNYYPSVDYLSNKVEIYNIQNKTYSKFKSQLDYHTGGFGFIDIYNYNLRKHYNDIFQVSLIIGGWIQNDSYIEPTPRCYFLFFLNNGKIKYKYLPNLPINIVYPNLIMDKNHNIYVMGGKNPSKIMYSANYNNYNCNINENRILYLSINYKEISKSKWYILPKKLDSHIQDFLLCNVQSEKYFYLLELKKKLKEIKLKVEELQFYLNIPLLPYCYYMLENSNLTFPSSASHNEYSNKYSNNLLKFISFLKSNDIELKLNFENVKDARTYIVYFLTRMQPRYYIANRIKIHIPELSVSDYSNTCLFYFPKTKIIDSESNIDILFKKSISLYNDFKYKINLNEMQKRGYECSAEILGKGKKTVIIIKKTNELYLKTLNIRKDIKYDLKICQEKYYSLNKEIEGLVSKN